MILNVLLWVGGVALLGIGIAQARAPYARLQGLRAAAENASRYEGWRGVRRSADDRTVTGADVMRQHLGARLRLWGTVAVAGVILIVAGFVIR